MKHPAILLLSGLAMATLSIGHGAQAASVAEKTGVNALIGASPTTADFVQEAVIGDMFEIRSSQLAVDKGDAATKVFAARMVADHQKTSAELGAMLAAGTVNAVVPTALDPAHQKMLDRLRSLSGSDFSKQYRADQLSAHKDAVSLFQRYAKGGNNQSLRSWTAQTEPALEHHLSMAQEL